MKMRQLYGGRAHRCPGRRHTRLSIPSRCPPLPSGLQGEFNIAPVIRDLWNVRFTLLWNLWSQTLQTRVATPSLRSIRTVTDLSWWQNRHVKVVSGNVRYERHRRREDVKYAPNGTFCLAGAGFLEDFLRLPMVVERQARRQPAGSSGASNGRAITCDYALLNTA